MSNTWPQIADLNRQYWAGIEEWVRLLVRRRNVEGVVALTLPLYIPTERYKSKFEPVALTAPETTAVDFRRPGTRRAAERAVIADVVGSPLDPIVVPTHFAKVLLVERTDGQLLAGAVVVPNAPVKYSVPLENCVAPIWLVERFAGLDLLGVLFDESRAAERVAFVEKEWCTLPHETRRWLQKRYGIELSGASATTVIAPPRYATIPMAHRLQAKSCAASVEPLLARPGWVFMPRKK